MSDNPRMPAERDQAGTLMAQWLSTVIPAMYSSDAALAEKVGVHPSLISRWRHGVAPRPANLYALAKATGVSMEYLVTAIGYRPETATLRPPTPVQQPVVAAIVTSAEGVLIGRRNDGKPPWTFIAGEVEPGERPEDAAVREVKEETGCEIRTGEVIGQRVHPATGRTLIYMAAAPTHSTRLIVGDYAELAEVRWAALAEAEERMPDMFAPVREYLAGVLGTGSSP